MAPFSFLLSCGRNKAVKQREWTNCCRAPSRMKIEPPLPDGYTAWIHRAGWMLYVHEATQQGSWMHPGKLAQLEARGLKGPSKIGPEMYIWEQNVNRADHYIVDYAYPPWGRIVSAMSPTPGDFSEIDELGYAAWAAKEKERKEEWHREHDKDAGTVSVDDKMRAYFKLKRKVRREQGIGMLEDSEEEPDEKEHEEGRMLSNGEKIA